MVLSAHSPILSFHLMDGLTKCFVQSHKRLRSSPTSLFVACYGLRTDQPKQSFVIRQPGIAHSSKSLVIKQGKDAEHTHRASSTLQLELCRDEANMSL